ncbi:LysR family transcriptional regulator [Methylobacterium sp. J-070]|uniref:LysR family transcriptional regulator n=1 Tax=Methylobacterium sp. J-070 TaxID=2836650 RepID=UPI001FBB0FB3|nr:LysR family transcriptional regulator [Methylobacterium sp. J-070]MCJ2048409.1 LysR family transcriptional regulator [Methylobacterium sp. J-070]
MDRIDAMRVFVAAVDQGSLAGAGRKLGRSPAAVSRAIASLEAHLGVPLLNRSTRFVRPSDAGLRYHAACRDMLDALDEADRAALAGHAVPRGTLNLTAPVIAWETLLRPVLDRFMDANPEVCLRLHLHDRPVNLVEEGIDVALRIAHLPDSALVATALGKVRRVVVAAPRYLKARTPIASPADLADHAIVAMSHFGLDAWSFPPLLGSSSVPRVVRFAPRLAINNVAVAVAAAVQGRGVTRLFSYHVASDVSDGRLQVLLADHEPAPLPVHLLSTRARLSVPTVRAFVDFAVPLLRERFAGFAAMERSTPDDNARPPEDCRSRPEPMTDTA